MQKNKILNVIGFCACTLLVLAFTTAGFYQTLHQVTLSLGIFLLLIFVALRGVTYEPAEELFIKLSTASESYPITRIKMMTLLETCVYMYIIVSWSLLAMREGAGLELISLGFVGLALVQLIRPFAGLRSDLQYTLPIALLLMACCIAIAVVVFISMRMNPDPLPQLQYYNAGLATLSLGLVWAGNALLSRAAFHPGYMQISILLFALSMLGLHQPSLRKVVTIDSSYERYETPAMTGYQIDPFVDSTSVAQSRLAVMLSTLQAADDGEINHSSSYYEAEWIITELPLSNAQTRLHVEAIVVHCVQKTTDRNMLAYALKILDKLEQTQLDDSMSSYYQNYRKQLNAKL